MAHFICIGNIVINEDHIIDVTGLRAKPGEIDEETGKPEKSWARITTTAFNGGDDGVPDNDTWKFSGARAELVIDYFAHSPNVTDLEKWKERRDQDERVRELNAAAREAGIDPDRF